MTRTRGLIVDDEPAVRTALGLALEDAGWQVEAVESSERALGRLKETTFDIVVIDKNLPGMGGVDLIRAIRKTDEHILLVLITGYASVASAMETLELGVNGYLEK